MTRSCIFIVRRNSDLAGKTWRYIILGDEKNLDMKALEKLGTIKRVSTEEIFGY